MRKLRHWKYEWVSRARWKDSIIGHHLFLYQLCTHTHTHMHTCMHIMAGGKGWSQLKIFLKGETMLLSILMNSSSFSLLWVDLTLVTGVCGWCYCNLVVLWDLVLILESLPINDEDKAANIGLILMVVSLACADGAWDTISLGSLHLLTWALWKMIPGPQGKVISETGA